MRGDDGIDEGTAINMRQVRHTVWYDLPMVLHTVQDAYR